MSKLEIFWTTLAMLLLISLMSFLIFVAYIYYDTAMTLRECALSLKKNHERQVMPLNINHEESNWLEIMDNADEVT